MFQDTTTHQMFISTTEARTQSGYSFSHLSLLLRTGVLYGKRISGRWVVSLEQYLAVPHKPGPKKKGIQ